MEGAIYARSTTNDPTSIEKQILCCYEYAKLRYWPDKLALIGINNDISGGELKRCTAIIQLSNLIRGHPRPLDVLIVSDLARISRTVTDFLTILKELRASGIIVIRVH